METYPDFILAYEAYDDKEFLDNYYYWQRRAALTSTTLFKFATSEHPLTAVLANAANFWLKSVVSYVEVLAEYDKRWAKVNVEAYKICKEIGIEQTNQWLRDGGFNLDIALDDDIDEWIDYYQEKLSCTTS